MTPVGWWPYQVDLLKRLWAEGKPASEIALELGPRFTRNSVIGKANRLGLAPRESPIGKPPIYPFRSPA